MRRIGVGRIGAGRVGAGGVAVGRFKSIGVVLAMVVTGCQVGDGSGPASPATSSSAPSTPTGPAPSTAVSGQPPLGFAAAQLRARVDEPEIEESSGLVASRTAPGLYWTHEDSGADPLIYCVLGSTRGCGTWRVSGATADDWEDIAAGPGPEPGRSYLYIADIGDNEGRRPEVTVWRVPEPRPALDDGSTPRQPRATEAAEAITLRYPDGPRDAEALMVHPQTGDLYLVTKGLGPAEVYRASGPGVMARVAQVRAGRGEPVTGGDISPDGGRVALATLFGGYEFSATESAFESVWTAAPTPVDLGERKQGESVAYRLDGNALLATSEDDPMVLWEAVRLMR
ncbi:MAG: hypothetical protein ACT4OS_04740 [Acidimicrobiales bacterium]